jgi:hypothetical protein
VKSAVPEAPVPDAPFNVKLHGPRISQGPIGLTVVDGEKSLITPLNCVGSGVWARSPVVKTVIETTVFPINHQKVLLVIKEPPNLRVVKRSYRIDP